MRSFWRRSILGRFLVGTFIISIVSFGILLYHAEDIVFGKSKRRIVTVPFIAEKCHQPVQKGLHFIGSQALLDTANSTADNIEARVLIVLRSSSVTFRGDIIHILESNRISYQHVFLTEKTVFPPLSSSGVGSFSVIVFESIRFYYYLNRASRQLVDDYCREFSVGIVLFSEQENYGSIEHSYDRLHLRIQTGLSGLRNGELNPKSRLLRLTRAGGTLDRLPKTRWNVFSPNHSTYEPVEFATSDITRRIDDVQEDGLKHTVKSQKHHTVLLDYGQLDGICRVYFGYGLQFWLHKLLFMDALALLSRGKHAKSLDRWLVVDIDDIFVGKTGTRLTKEDVKVGVHAYFDSSVS